MTDVVTITIPSSIVNQHLPLLIERLCQIPNIKVNDHGVKMKDVVAHLYVQLLSNLSKEVSQKLLHCLSNNTYDHFIKFLDWVEDYESDHCIILEYLSQKINPGIYSSIVEDDDFNQKLVDLLINNDEKDDDIDDVLKSYYGSMAENPILSSESREKVDKVKNFGEEKFESILSSLGLDEAGMTKARKIKADAESGQPLNMAEIMAFSQEYKSNIDAANLDIPKLMSLVFASPSPTANSTANSTSNTTEPTSPLPFDLGSIMNALGPMLSNLTQPQKGKSRRGRRR